MPGMKDGNGRGATAPQGDRPRPGPSENKELETATDAWRAVAAELFGTFLLTFVGAGAVVIGAVTHGEVERAARVVSPALLVMAMIYSIGAVSGAHINPGVTLAFALRNDFPWRRVPAYWLAQFAGAILAAALLLSFYGNQGRLGAPDPKHGVGLALGMEAILTCILVSVILATSKKHRSEGPEAAIAVGATIALCGLFASPISGAVMNQAVALGPSLVSGKLDTAWVYLAGPLAGDILAVILAWVIQGPPNPSEGEAATGKGASQEE